MASRKNPHLNSELKKIFVTYVVKSDQIYDAGLWIHRKSINYTIILKRMKQFNLVHFFYPIPLVFFVLTGSANLNGPRIGIVLGMSIVLFLTVGYIRYRRMPRKPNRIIDAMAIAIFIACIYAGMSVNAEFASMIFIWPLLYFDDPKKKSLKVPLRLLQAVVLFCLIYFGINQYSFENLLGSKTIILAMVFLFQFLFISTQFGWNSKLSMSREIGLSFFGAVFSLLLFSWLMFDFKYALYLVLLTVPAIYILIKLPNVDGKDGQRKYVRYFRIFSIAGLTIFNLFLFLDTTQVLQAVQGGY